MSRILIGGHDPIYANGTGYQRCGSLTEPALMSFLCERGHNSTLGLCLGLLGTLPEPLGSGLEDVLQDLVRGRLSE